jgi:hypothetical protein
MPQDEQDRNSPPPPPGPLAKGTPWLIGLAILLYVASLWLYFYGIGADRYDTIESTRPVLVFTLIVAMLGFGGLLIFRSLFAPEDDLGKRFAHAREIFLIFSGIFGTIIGFYFGAADENDATPPSLTEPIYENGRIAVEIGGGVAPFIALLTRESRPDDVQMRQGEARALSFVVGPCPPDASITVVDGEGNRDQSETTCPAETAGGASNAAATANGSAAPVNATGP